jgi:histidine triad (HIT) family protein
VAAACIFCEIVAGKRQAHWVWQEETTVAFLDARPLFPGHTLVVPRQHMETLSELPPADLEPVFRVVQRVMRGIESGLGADGTFVANNNRVSQSVPHLHIHVVPRRKGDGLKGFFWPRVPYASDAEAAATAARIRASITSEK